MAGYGPIKPPRKHVVTGKPVSYNAGVSAALQRLRAAAQAWDVATSGANNTAKQRYNHR